MIQVSDISYSYGRKKLPVLEHFSLQLEAGHVYGLLGKNGTGKSTLLYLLCGLLRPQEGKVLYEGSDVKERRPETQAEIFLVSEDFELPDMSLESYVRLNAPFYPRFSYEVFHQCMDKLEMDADVHLSALSMGQRKKAFMSFALATQARLILMDEPTNGLDIPSKALFRSVVASHLAADSTLVISTHQVGDIDMLLDHVLLLDESRLLVNCSTAEICRRLRFEEWPMGTPVEDALYVQPSLQGQMVILPNDDPERETPLNLELLFNAALAGKLPQLAKDN